MESLITPLLDDLLYPSESDEPVAYFSREWPNEQPPQLTEMAALLDRPERETITEHDPARFWELVTNDQSWYGPEEQERTRRFVELRQVLETNLTHLKYFEAGEIEVTLLLLGLNGTQLCGVMTMAVRT